MIRIVVLVENSTKNKNLMSEHGVCFLVEADNKKILFDVGATDLFLKNAKVLSINLEEIDCIALSHGHYDHVGGLEYLRNKKVYVHPDIFIPKYDYEAKNYEYAGFPCDREYYEQLSGMNFVEIKDSLSLTPNIKLHVNFKKLAPNSFCLKIGDNYQPDLFADELSLSINTPSGLIIITGCAHSGVLNILDKVILDQNNDNIFAFLGGFHLAGLNKAEAEEVAKKLESYNINKIGISHCTGNQLINYLVKPEVFRFNVGDELIL